MNERVLLVEDEPVIRQLIATALEKEGYTVTQAPHGAAAVTTFADIGADIDLLITDMRMPGMNGPELIEHLRQRRRSLKVLIITGYPGTIRTSDIDERIDFLIKPFAREELLRATRRLLEGENPLP